MREGGTAGEPGVAMAYGREVDLCPHLFQDAPALRLNDRQPQTRPRRDLPDALEFKRAEGAGGLFLESLDPSNHMKHASPRREA